MQGWRHPRRPFWQIGDDLGRGPRITGGLVVLHPDAAYLEERCELIQAVVQGIENALHLDREGHRRAELAWRDRLSRVG